MATEQKTNPNIIQSDTDFLKHQEELLRLAKEGNKEALQELQQESVAEKLPIKQDQEKTSDVENVYKVSSELKPNTSAVSEAIKNEEAAVSQKMLNEMIIGNLDVTDPSAVAQALIRINQEKMGRS